MHKTANDWRLVRLGDVVHKIENNLDDPNNSGYERFIKVEHMDADALKIRRWGLLAEEQLPPTFRKVFKTGQILYPTRNPHLRRTAYADFDGICGEKTLTLEPKEELAQELFPFIFQREDFIRYTSRLMIGSTNPHIRWRDLAGFKFPLPLLDEQRRIAEILWAAEKAITGWQDTISETIRAKHRLAYELYQFAEIRKSNPKIPEGYKIGTLVDLSDINPSKPREIADDFEVSFIGMADISDEGGIQKQQFQKYAEVKSGYTYFAEGDILFPKITPCMENGKGAIAQHLLNGTGFGSTEFYVIRPYSDSDRNYLYQLTMNGYFRKRAEAFMVGTAGQQRVQSDFLKKFFKFIIPPVARRIEIGGILSAFDERLEAEKTNLRHLQDVKVSLLTSLLKSKETTNV